VAEALEVRGRKRGMCPAICVAEMAALHARTTIGDWKPDMPMSSQSRNRLADLLMASLSAVLIALAAWASLQ